MPFSTMPTKVNGRGGAVGATGAGGGGGGAAGGGGGSQLRRPKACPSPEGTAREALAAGTLAAAGPLAAATGALAAATGALAAATGALAAATGALAAATGALAAAGPAAEAPDRGCPEIVALAGVAGRTISSAATASFAVRDHCAESSNVT